MQLSIILINRSR